MKKNYAILDEEPTFFDDDPSTSSELRRGRPRPSIDEDLGFRACFDVPEVLARAWRRSAGGPPAAASARAT
jgi:hypothetical protein